MPISKRTQLKLTEEIKKARAGLIPESDWAEPTNGERCNRIECLMLTYRKFLTDGPPEPEETDLADLLTDCMHWAEREGLDFDEELKTARMHYNAEKGEES
jgi:hypothetical protein